MINELRPIYPSEGKVLTNGLIYSDEVIYLGVNDSEENYYEITKEEYEQILAPEEEARLRESEMMACLTPDFENDKLKEEI